MTRLVGRDHETGLLRGALEEARAGSGGLILLTGEPGIGKTRLCEELAAYARAASTPIFWGRCIDGDGAPVYWPWTQIVRKYVRENDRSVVLAEMGQGAADIALLHGELRDWSNATPEPARNPAYARFRFLDHIAEFLGAASRRIPLVLILEDVHSADTPSLLLLQFLARTLAEHALLIVATYRASEVRGDDASSTILGAIERYPHARAIRLCPLSDGEVLELIGAADPGRLPARAVAQVCAEAEGNPFFIIELVRLLSSRDGSAVTLQAVSAGPDLPPGIRQMVAQRLVRLSEEGRQMLRAAAVIGRDFAPSVLERVTGLERGQLLERLSEARNAGIVSEGPPGRFRFEHALVREVLYQGLSLADRLRLHRRVGSALESLVVGDEERWLSEIAHHFFQAAPGGSADKAIDYAQRTASHALKLLAFEDAAFQLERVLPLLDLDPMVDPSDRCDVLLVLGRARWGMSERSLARRAYCDAAEVARRHGLADALAQAAIGAALLCDPLRSPTDEHEELETKALLEEALAGLADGDSGVRALVMAYLARLLPWKEAARAMQLGEDAVEMARRVGDRTTLARVIGQRHLNLLSPEHLQRRLAEAQEIVALAAAGHDASLLIMGHQCLTIDLLELGDMAAVDGELLVQARLAAEPCGPSAVYFLKVFQATCARMRGEFDGAECFAVDALQLGARIGLARHALMTYGVHLTRVLMERGGLEQILSRARANADLFLSVPSWRCGVAWICASLGLAEARTHFEALATSNFADLPRNHAWLSALAHLSETCAFLQDKDRAAGLYRLLVPFAEHNISSGSDCSGSAARYLGILTTTMEAWDAAECHFDAARRVNEQMGAKPFLAHTLHEYACMLHARGRACDRGRARDFATAALGITETIGMPLLAVRLRSMIATDGSTPQSAGVDETRLPGTANRRDSATTCNGGAAAQRSPPMVESPRPEPTVDPPGQPLPCADVAGSETVFRREGDYWTIVHQGHLFRLQDSLGLGYLSILLRDTGRGFLVTELVGLARGDAAVAAGDGTYDFTSELRSRRSLSDAGETIDRPAASAYRHRLEELRDEITEANAFNDLGRGARAQSEMEFVLAELARDIGLHGRPRRAGSDLERARQNVTRTIRDAIRRIAANNPTLGRHLDASVQTGRVCSYQPPREHRVRWRL